MDDLLARKLPDFERPPLVEVVLGVQFARIPGLDAMRVGMLWQQHIRKHFPRVEEHRSLESIIEQFDTSQQKPALFRIQVQSQIPPQRFWFLNEKGTELIQLQQDKLIQNWRKAGGQEYPRYEYIRERFTKSYETLSEFLRQENLGEIKPNQCEVTYVNEIEPSEASGKQLTLDEVVSLFGHTQKDFLPNPEHAEIAARFLINEAGKNIGRLHIAVTPRIRLADNRQVYLVELTARGAPLEASLEGVSGFMDIVREWVVRGFTDITTKAMHAVWGRKC